MLLTLFEKIRKSSRWRHDLRPAGKTQMKTKQNSAKVGSLNFRAVMTAHDTWHFQHVACSTSGIHSYYPYSYYIERTFLTVAKYVLF